MRLGFLQLGLLIWKCWKTESRNPARLAAEILVPLLMFIMLAGFRMAFKLKTIQPECHFDAKPMPSAGAVPFLQGLVCNYENVCNENKTRSEYMRYPFNETIITSLVRDTEAMNQKLSFNPSDLLVDGSFLRVMQRLYQARDLFLGRTLPPDMQSFAVPNGIWNLFCDRPNKVLSSRSNSSSSSSASPFNFGGSGQTTQSPLAAMMAAAGGNMSAIDPCTLFISQFQYNPALKQLWNAVANIFRGKVVYYPDTPLVRKLIKRIDKLLDWPTALSLAIIDGVRLLETAAQNYRQTTQSQLEAAGLSSAEAAEILRIVNSPEYQELLRVHLVNFVFRMQCFRPAAQSSAVTSSISSFMSSPSSFSPQSSNPTPSSMTSILSGLMDTLKALPPTFALAVVANRSSSNRFEGYNATDQMIAQALVYSNNDSLFGAIEFKDADKLSPSATNLPPLVRYSLRLDPSKLDAATEVKARSFNVQVRRDPFKSEMPYFTSGFIYLQDAVEKAIIAEQEAASTNSRVSGASSGSASYSGIGAIMQQFPFPCYMLDQFIANLANQLLLFIVLGWIFPAAMIVKSVVLEKEHKLREVARIMGISPGLHFLSWYIFWLTLLLISIILFLLIVRGSTVFVYANPGIILLVMLAYASATISLSFFFSAFFSRANIAAVVGGLGYFMTYIAFGGISNGNAESLNFQRMMLSSLLPNVALGFGWNIIGRYELMLEGSQRSNFNVPLSDEPEDQYTLFHCFIMLLVDSLLYYFVAWYVEHVYPGEYGVPRPWYFVFQPSFWCDCRSKKATSDDDDKSRAGSAGPKKPPSTGLPFEDEPTHLSVGCSLDSLMKIYDLGIIDRIKMKLSRSQRAKQTARRAAVDNLSLNMYEGQITALLGHNGAGKTTTMSMMTGLISATSGKVKIGGHDVETELEEVRKILGFCPQFNVLYDNLTVGEHLWFYGRIRGIENSVISEDIERMLQDTNLTVKRHEPARVLSGGMRRRLSIAVAFIGNSKCVILDEPTAGVDPYARRALWDLLSKFRPGRTIVLSTHHMDEAEILADRIAIVSQGRLQTCGSPLFLKEQCGDGYQLSVVRKDGQAANKKSTSRPSSSKAEKDNGFGLSEADKKQEQRITDFIKQQLSPSGCTLVDHVAGELTYKLSYSSVPKFAPFFSALDKSKQDLGIADYGLSDSTMEEIFIKIADLSDKNAAKAANNEGGKQNEAIAEDEEDEGDDAEKKVGDEKAAAVAMPEMPKYDLLSGAALTSQQLWALLVKRFHRMRRNWKGFISELILPIVFVLLGVVIIKSAEYTPGNAPTLELQPWLMAPSSKSTREQRLYSFFSTNYFNSKSSSASFAATTDQIQAAVTKSEYAGARCMDQGVYKIDNYPCQASSVDSQWQSNNDRYRQRSCECTPEGVQRCSATSAADPRNAYLPNYGNVNYRYLRSTDDMLNLTGYDVADYIIDQYSAVKSNFYGGFSYLVPMAQEIAEPYNRPSSSSSSSTSSPPSAFVTGLVTPSSLMVWYNNKGFLSNVAYNNYANNLLLRMAVSPSVDRPVTNFGIVGYNQPLNYTKEQFTKELTRSILIDVLLAIMLILALSFVPASFIMFLIEDRVSDSKHVQIVSGLRPAIYWFGNYTWDCLNFLIPAAVCLIIFAIFNLQAYINERGVGALFLLFVLYGFACAPMLYPTSFVLDTPSTAFVLLACANLFIGAATSVATWFLDLLATTDPSIKDVNDILKVVFFIFPQYCLGRGLIEMATNYRKAQGQAYFLGRANFLDDVKPFDWDVCGKFLFALALHLVGWFLVVLIIEYRMSIFRCCVTCRQSCNTTQVAMRKRNGSVSDSPRSSPVNGVPSSAGSGRKKAEDPDVKAEREAVIADEGGDDSSYAMLVKNLTKQFRTRRRGTLTAVNRLTFGVLHGECFGLLGVNGAGKSTTFNMLTGRLMPTSGSATIRGFDILGARNDANKMIGYCPQYDCITPLLTGRENLEFFSRLRGVPEKYVKQVAVCNYTRMDLLRHAEKPAGTYSGGNKRKLSAAIAITGEPPLVFLDEPTAGMDPRARRFLWRVITNLLLNGQSVVLTTHSMDECEALCTRLAIMVNGEFRCLGSPQHLKARFGEGYLVNLRFKEQSRDADSSAMKSRCNAALKALSDRFTDVQLKEAHDNVAVYALGASGKEPVRLGDLFGFLTNSSTMSSLAIAEYSVMQASLDAVFVTFAKMQTSDDTAIDKNKDDDGVDNNDGISDLNNNREDSAGSSRRNNKTATSAV